MNLREKRNDLVGKMEDILARTSDNGMTAEEQNDYTALEAEVVRLDIDIEARDRAAERAKKLDAPQAAPAGVHKPSIVKVYEDEDRLYRAAFDNYLRGRGLSTEHRNILEHRAQSVGTPAEGGYLVPDGFRQKLVEVRKAFGGLAAYVDEFSTSTGNPLEYPTLNDTANVGGITSESAAFVDGADLVFGTVTLGAYKFTSTGAGTTTPLRVSVELLQDSAFDIESLVARKLGERIARKQADAWINGSGTGEPQGIFDGSPDQSVDVADTLDYDDLLSLEGALDPAYEANARWVMSKGTWNVVRAIVDGDNRPLIQANAQSGIGGGVEKMLLGYPVIIDQACATFGSATGPSTNLALGDWAEAYALRRVSSLTVVVNPWTRANNGQVEFTAYERADGVIQNRSAFVSLANL